MDLHSSPDNTTSSLPAGKVTRKQCAEHLNISLRQIDELTRRGVLPYYKIGKSVRYDLSQVESALLERFHVAPKAKKPKQQ